MKTYDNQNLFAKIIRGEIPCDKVYEDENIFAFKDINPAAPTHILVLPKGEYMSFNDFVQKADPQIITNFFQKTQQLAAENNLIESGYRLIANHGDNASQSVHHFHLHLIGGRALGGLVPGDLNAR
jgi:diadenosine tetraphosphate (Ap4A) HIT family hydrolase